MAAVGPLSRSRDMIEAAKSLKSSCGIDGDRRGMASRRSSKSSVLSQSSLNDEQRRAFEYLVGDGDAKAIAVAAGVDKDALLTAARLAWNAEGCSCGCRALSDNGRKFASRLGHRVADPRTLEDGWQQGRDC